MRKIAQITARYIASNPVVAESLAMDLVNYSKLARRISSDESIEKSKVDAVIVACRRYASKLRKQKRGETGIGLLKKSRKSIKIANNKASITFTVSEKYLAKVLDILK